MSNSPKIPAMPRKAATPGSVPKSRPARTATTGSIPKMPRKAR